MENMKNSQYKKKNTYISYMVKLTVNRNKTITDNKMKVGHNTTFHDVNILYTYIYKYKIK